jgi:hypothetical protein
MDTNWEQLAADKRARIAKSIPSDWRIQDLPKEDCVFDYPKLSGLLSSQELEITSSSATALVEKLAKGQLKSVDVTLAFCKRAALAQQLVSSSAPNILSTHVNLTDYRANEDQLCTRIFSRDCPCTSQRFGSLL